MTAMNRDVFTAMVAVIGPEVAVARSLHGVCRAWRSVIVGHAGWEAACERADMRAVTRPDGVAIDWCAHFLSHAQSQHMQGEAMSAVMHRENVFLTGPGGTGSPHTPQADLC